MSDSSYMYRVGLLMDETNDWLSEPEDVLSATPYKENLNCSAICNVVLTGVQVNDVLIPASYAHCWPSESNNELVSTASVNPENKPEELITYGTALFGTKVAMCDGIFITYLNYLFFYLSFSPLTAQVCYPHFPVFT